LLFELLGYFKRRLTLIRSSTEGKNVASPAHFIAEKFHGFLLFLFGLLVLAFEYSRRAFRAVNPVKVGPSLT